MVSRRRRRELFDEAAGIVKFKRRKNTTIKKLEEERQNLVQCDRYPLRAYQTAGTSGEAVRDSEDLSGKKRDS